MASHPPSSNMDVDYVISFRFPQTDQAAAIAAFEKLVQALASVGLDSEVRPGNEPSLLLFTRVASDEHLFGEVYRSRVRDWIYGVRTAAPPTETRQALETEPLYEAERLRIIYQLITNPASEGGAGITPKEGEWAPVQAIFALHDRAYNREWIKTWSTQYFLGPADLDQIRNRLGEKIAFYFAFTQSYFAFLIFPAVFGLSAWLLFGHFSPLYAVVNAVWCTVFTEYWKHQETDLAVRWGVRGVSRIEHQRRDFKHEKEMTDPVTGETVQFFPATKRLQRQLLQVPFTLGATVVLGSLIATCFGIEIFISEIYAGPFKTVLVFLPTLIATAVMPMLTGILSQFATKLNDYENYETHGSYDTALTQKIFVMNFITSYLPILLTAFVYVPFGNIVVPYLDVFRLTVKAFAEDEKQLQLPETGFTINPNRLRAQVFYFTVTAQVVNLAMELVVPYLKRRGVSKFKEIQSQRPARREPSDAREEDSTQDAAFLERVRSEAELEVYDVTQDLREMVLQFGYLSLFSVVWPLTAVSFVINDWVELRADAIKICVEMQRPTPWRADTIGPWLDSLSFLTWLGSVTTSALVYLFSNDGLGPDGTPANISVAALLLAVLGSEHAFFVLRWIVRIVISKLDSPGLAKERRERFLVRKQFFDESLSRLKKMPPPMAEEGGRVDRTSLEEDARLASLKDSSSTDRFWARQKGWRETVEMGRRLMEQQAAEKCKEA